MNNQITTSTDRPENGRLANKIALVTGAGRGIGEAIACLFASEGAIVVLASRSQEEIERVAERIKIDGGQAMAVQTDVSQATGVEALVRQTIDVYGRLDIAVNNAGMGSGNKPFAEVPEELFDRVIAINLKGIFLTMKYELAALQASGGGAIVNMSSTVGLVGSGAGIAPYVASKHGIVGLTKAAALEYARYGIRVNAIAPGTTRTPATDSWLANEQTSRQITSRIPLGRVAEGQDVAEAALWLCSDASSYLTGVTLPVDGGFVVA